MKRVVIVGSDFSPSSLPPATRIRFFAKHLPEFGWEPIVLTTKPEYYDWKIDPENEELLPELLKVVRTDAWRSSWTRRLGIGDVGMRSLWHHWRALKRICKESKVDLVFIPVPPSVPMILGRLAHERLGIPYVVDYIDPWVTEYYWKRPKHERPPKWPIAYALSRILEPFALKKVGHITGVSAGTTDSVISRYSRLSAADATEIPYGAEPGDFDYLRDHPRKNSIFNKDDALFHLSYVGACIRGMYPTVRALFQAVRLGLDKQPELFSRLRLHFVGSSYSYNGASPAQVAEIAGEIGIADYVDEKPGRVPYLDSLQIMLDSDGLFLVGSDEPHYTASKVFPYLLAGRPLLAIFREESSVVKIVRESGVGSVIAFNASEPPNAHSEEIFERLLEMLSSPPLDRRRSPSTIIEQYSTREMAFRLSTVFDRATRNREDKSRFIQKSKSAIDGAA